MTKKDLEKIAEKWANHFELDPDLVKALIEVESAWDTWAVRFEPGWRWYLNPKKWSRLVQVSERTEEICQAMSWGLCQVMGTVARELGHKEDIPKLCEPEVGIYYGCKKLKKEIDRWDSIRNGLAAYNAGSPYRRVGQQYADKVTNVMMNVTNTA